MSKPDTSEYNYNQERLDLCMNRVYDRFMESHVPEEAINEIMTEWKGGKCLDCGKEYVEVHVKNRFANFKYFKPTCDCWKNKKGLKERDLEITTKLKIAQVPSLYLKCSFENWDYDIGNDTNEAFNQVMEYARQRKYIETGLVLYGKVGTGKTRCAVSVLREIAATRFYFAFRLMSDVLADLDDRFKATNIVNQILEYDIVLFDDLDKAASQSKWLKERIFRLWDRMISAKKIIIATANFRGPEEFVEKLGDANTSRLISGCDFIKFEGEDYRKR